MTYRHRLDIISTLDSTRAPILFNSDFGTLQIIYLLIFLLVNVGYGATFAGLWAPLLWRQETLVGSRLSPPPYCLKLDNCRRCVGWRPWSLLCQLLYRPGGWWQCGRLRRIKLSYSRQFYTSVRRHLPAGPDCSISGRVHAGWSCALVAGSASRSAGNGRHTDSQTDGRRNTYGRGLTIGPGRLPVCLSFNSKNGKS